MPLPLQHAQLQNAEAHIMFHIYFPYGILRWAVSDHGRTV